MPGRRVDNEHWLRGTDYARPEPKAKSDPKNQREEREKDEDEEDEDEEEEEEDEEDGAKKGKRIRWEERINSGKEREGEVMKERF